MLCFPKHVCAIYQNWEETCVESGLVHLHIAFFLLLLGLSFSSNHELNRFTVLHCTGPWRWFDENMLDCCESLEKVKNTGITFGKVVCLAHCAGAKVEAFRTTQSTIDDFRKYVMACASSEDCHVISAYHRGVFKQVNTDCAIICKIFTMTCVFCFDRLCCLVVL